MRSFALVAVAMAVLPSALSMPVFMKRSDTPLDNKNQKSERTSGGPSISIKGNVKNTGDACQLGLIIVNSASQTACNFGQRQQPPPGITYPFGQGPSQVDPLNQGLPFTGQQPGNPLIQSLDPTGTLGSGQTDGMESIGSGLGLGRGVLPAVDQLLNGQSSENPGITGQLGHILTGQEEGLNLMDSVGKMSPGGGGLLGGLEMKEAKKDKDAKTAA